MLQISRVATTAKTTRGKAPCSIQIRYFTTDGKPAILLPKDVDPSKLIFKLTKQTKSTGPKIIHVNYETENRLIRIQTPGMTLPFGVTKSDRKGGEPSQSKVFTMCLSFDALDTNPEQKRFYDIINAIDSQAITTAHKEAKNWFDKDVPLTVLEHNYKRSIRGNTEKYPPLMKLKIPLDIDKDTKQPTPRAHVWLDKNQVSIDEISARCKTINIIELKYIWVISHTMLGATWGLLQSKIVDKPVERLGSYSFIETPKTAPTVTAGAAPSTATTAAPKAYSVCGGGEHRCFCIA